MTERPETDGYKGRADHTALGDWVRATRQSQGVSQRALADRSGISRSYLCDIERGRGMQPSVATIDKLAKALGASRGDLLRVAGILEPTGKVSDERELRLLALFRDLPPDAQGMLERMARFLHTEEHRWVQPSLIGEDNENAVPPALQRGPRLFDV
jgi:transcriptional regulator with XRE-family HTH domain